MATLARGARLLLGLSLTLTLVTAADDLVQQVTGPNVVKEALGPLMEVATREQRAASFPMAAGCLSCTVGSHGHPHDGVHSSRQEHRSEQRFVNGQPVYDLFHERRIEDGRIVHDRRVEKDEDDLGYRPRTHGAYPSQSSLTRSSANRGYNHGVGTHQYMPTHSASSSSRSSSSNFQSSYGSNDLSSESSDTFGSDFARMQENLRRQMMNLGSPQPTYGGSQRSEYSSQVRYVNGQPVYEKKEERKYKNGELVHENTHEKGPEDFGTEGVVRQYDEHGALITDGALGGDSYHRQWETREQLLGSTSHRPAYRPSYSSHSRDQHHSSTYPSHRPLPRPTTESSSSTRYTQTHPSRSPNPRPAPRPYYPTHNHISSEQRNTELHTSSSSPSYPPRRPTYTRPATSHISNSESDHNSDEDTRSPSSPYNPSSRPTYTRPATSHTNYDYNSRDDTHSSYPSAHSPYPSRGRPSTPHHRPDTGESSAHVYYREESRHSHSDSDLTRQRPSPGTDDLHLTQVQPASRTPDDEEPSSQHVQHTSETRDSTQTPHTRPGRYRGYGQNEGVSGSDYPHRRPGVHHRRPDTDEPENEPEDDLYQRPDIEDEDNRGRSDISPLEDGLVPTVPTVDNEMVVPDIAPSPVEDESGERDNDINGIGGVGGAETHRSHVASSETRYNSRVRLSGTSPAHHVRPGYSRESSYEDKTTTSNNRPATTASRHYQYRNDTSRRTSVVGEQEPFPAGLPCTRANGCVVVTAPHTDSYRSEIRTTYRYVNGRLVGMTQHERKYKNGEMVDENTTQHGRDEVAHLNLQEFGIGQLDLPQEDIRPGIYSQQHEIREEKEYVDGQQIYDLHHEKHFADGNLVYNNRVELDEDDLRELGRGGVDLQVVDQSSEVTSHSRHHTAAGGLDTSSLLHQVTDGSHASSAPVYDSRRFESRREQEFVNGQPVYDLHHERLYKNGSLVYENRTEHDEDDLVRTGHHDALHNILAGNTLTTATQDSYNRPATVPYGSYGDHRGASHGGESYGDVSQTSNSYSQSAASYNTYGRTTDSPDQPGETNDYDRMYNRGSYGGSPGVPSGSVASESRSSYSSTSQNRVGTDLLTAHPPGSGSGRATTTVLGGSDLLLTGSGSLRSGSSGYDSDDSLESGSVTGSNIHSSSSSSSHHQLETSGRSRSGCLTCVLLAGSELHNSSSSSLGLSGGLGAGAGYSQRHEMNKMEHYEDGKLVHGQADTRRFQNGQLVHQDSQQYSDPDAQRSTSAYSDSSSSPSSSWSSWASWSSWSSGDPAPASGDVCASSPCHNGGTCLTGLYGPICTCSFGFTGSECEEAECTRGYCRHGGRCSVVGGQHLCQCPSGYTGLRCERRGRSRRRIAKQPHD